MSEITNAQIMAEAASQALSKAGASDIVCADVYRIVSASYQTTDRVRRICAQLVVLEQLELYRKLTDDERTDAVILRGFLSGKWNYSGIENYARTGKSHCAGNM